MSTDTITNQLVAQAATIARLRQDLDRLAHETTDTVADLLARIEELTGPPTGTSASPIGSAAWCWRDLGPHAQDELWTQLTAWVAYLRSRYPLARKIPECWDQHPELVEELTALWLAWQGAYQDRDAPLTAPADWHDRWLPGVLQRIEHGPFALACNATHEPRPASAYASGVGSNRSEFT